MTAPFNDPKKSPTQARIVLWVVAGGVGVYLLISGVIGIVSGGS